MNQVVHSKIVKMGNAFGIRIPRKLLDQAGLQDEVELLVEDGRLIIRAANMPADNEADGVVDRKETKLLEDTIFGAWDDDGWA